MDREYLRAKLISIYKLTDTDYGQLMVLEGEGIVYKAEHVKDMLERLYNDMSEGKDLIREQKNEFFPRVSNSVCKICGNPALESNNLCFEHLVCNVHKQLKQTDL